MVLYASHQLIARPRRVIDVHRHAVSPLFIKHIESRYLFRRTPPPPQQTSARKFVASNSDLLSFFRKLMSSVTKSSSSSSASHCRFFPKIFQKWVPRATRTYHGTTKRHSGMRVVKKTTTIHPLTQDIQIARW
jgi:hypothetical protein